MGADGNEFPVELTITRIAGVEPPRFTGYIRDITERRRRERERAAQHGVAQVLAEAATIDEAIPRLLQALAQSMNWELGAAWLVDDDAGGLRCRALWRSESIEASQFRELSRRLVIRRGVGPLGRVWSSGRPSSSEDAVRSRATRAPKRLPAKGCTARSGFRSEAAPRCSASSSSTAVIRIASMTRCSERWRPSETRSVSTSAGDGPRSVSPTRRSMTISPICPTARCCSIVSVRRWSAPSDGGRRWPCCTWTSTTSS